MNYSAGLDVGSTYTKAVVLSDSEHLVGRAMERTGFKLEQAAERALRAALEQAGLQRSDVAYVVTTGYGRYQIPFRDIQVTDLTADARGRPAAFPRADNALGI